MAATAVAPVAASRSLQSKDPLMIEVFVAIGSNLAGTPRPGSSRHRRAGNPARVRAAADLLPLRQLPHGPADQLDYVNAVARLATRLSPLALLDELQRIEQASGASAQG